LTEVGRLAEAKKSENLEFRRHLKTHHYPDGPFHILASEIEKQIDCTACGNCCRHMIVNVTEADIGRIAEYLVMPASDVRHLYTELTSGDRVLINRHDSCVFLDGNLCLVYDARPTACRDFPHVSPDTHTLGGRYSSICEHASVCPILYNALEDYKRVVGYPPHRSLR
jgi:Fe-S-cluster containining protein